jgi:hypothetical protein
MTEKEMRVDYERGYFEWREYYDNFKTLGRNDLCACGSGKKYKTCCRAKYENSEYVKVFDKLHNYSIASKGKFDIFKIEDVMQWYDDNMKKQQTYPKGDALKNLSMFYSNLAFPYYSNEYRGRY